MCRNKGYCNAVVASKDIKVLDFNQYHKSDKTPFNIYADTKCLINKID